MLIRYDIEACERALAVKGWLQKDLAEQTGLSASVVSNFFLGKTVQNDTAKTIVTKLGLRMADVILNSDEERVS